MQTAIIMGVGPEQGLGAQLCRRFAGLGLHVFVAGRTRAKLDKVVAMIEADGHSASAYVADAANEADVIRLFDEAAAQAPCPWEFTTPAITRQAGSLTWKRPISKKAGEPVVSAVSCLPVKHCNECAGSGGTLLFTGASASLRGRPGFGAFNSSKAALRTLAQALAKEYGPENIHVGHVIVDGAINGEKIRTRWPDYAEKLGQEGMISIDGIVDAYEYLYKQPATAWTFELDLRTSIESW